MERRNVRLPNGGMLELEVTERFYEAIRFEYSLDESIEITDDHIRLFVHDKTYRAVIKAEKEIIISG
jgi:hypothetical protein